MKNLYLKVNYENRLFSNKTFYYGFLQVEDEESEKIKEEFLKTGIIEMHPHDKKALWSDPIFDLDKKVVFDFSKLTEKEADYFGSVESWNEKYLVRGFIKFHKSGYKYYYWLEVEDES